MIAGAGAGKTETITRRILYLLTADTNLRPQNIVAFTFTEKAAQNMKDRIYTKLKEIRKQDVLQEIGEMFIGTIHSFCLRLLQEHFKRGEYIVLDDKQEVALLFQHYKDVFVNDYIEGKALSEKIQRFLKHVNIFYDELIDEARLEKYIEQRYKSFYRSLKNYEELLKELKILTFPLMTYLAVKELRQKLGVIEKLEIKHLIVDEFQDLNKCQYELVKLIGQKANIFIVGDPRQTIYQWRGSSNKFFEEFSKDFKNVKYVLIPENRRSAKSIVEYANKFSESFENTIKDPMESKREQKGIVQYYKYEKPEQEAEFIAKQIKKLVESGKCQYSDIAILLRSVKYYSNRVTEELDRNGIPYIVSGDAGLFKRPKILALRYFFAMLSKRVEYIMDPISGEKVCSRDFVKEGISHWKRATGAKASEKLVEKWINKMKKKEKYWFDRCSI